MAKSSKSFPKKIKDLGFFFEGESKAENIRKKVRKINNLTCILVCKDEIINEKQENISVLHYCAAVGSSFVIKLVFELSGADINIQTESGRTPLHFAVKCGNTEGLELLLNKCADIDARETANGYSPLHIACQRNDLGTVMKLLKAGAVADIKDHFKRKPKNLATNDRIKRYIDQHLKENIEKTKLSAFIDRQGTTESRLKKLEDDVEEIKVWKAEQEARQRKRKTQQERKTYAQDSGCDTSMDSLDDLNPKQNVEYAYMKTRRARMQKFYTMLLDSITNINDIVPILYSKGVFKLPFKEKLNGTTNSAKTEMVLDLVMKGDVSTYNAFLNSLVRTGHSNILRVLEQGVCMQAKGSPEPIPYQAYMGPSYEHSSSHYKHIPSQQHVNVLYPQVPHSGYASCRMPNKNHYGGAMF